MFAGFVYRVARGHLQSLAQRRFGLTRSKISSFVKLCSVRSVHKDHLLAPVSYLHTPYRLHPSRLHSSASNHPRILGLVSEAHLPVALHRI